MEKNDDYDVFALKEDVSKALYKYKVSIGVEGLSDIIKEIFDEEELFIIKQDL